MAEDGVRRKPGPKPGSRWTQTKGVKAQNRLIRLGFDPIGELVQKYRQLEGELERQEKLREGTLVELSTTGKPKAYRADVHQSIFDKQIKIGETLLRYAYGRVPETQIIEDRKALPLIVNLSKEGDTYVISDTQDGVEDSQDEYAEFAEMDDVYTQKSDQYLEERFGAEDVDDTVVPGLPITLS